MKQRNITQIKMINKKKENFIKEPLLGIVCVRPLQIIRFIKYRGS